MNVVSQGVLQGGEEQPAGRARGGNAKELLSPCFVSFSVKLEARPSARSEGGDEAWGGGSGRMKVWDSTEKSG